MNIDEIRKRHDETNQSGEYDPLIMHRDRGWLLDMYDHLAATAKAADAEIAGQRIHIAELEEELEGKSCMTKCPNCGELASSSETNANAYIRKLEGEIVRLNKEISYLLEEIESLESKPLLFMEVKE